MSASITATLQGKTLHLAVSGSWELEQVLLQSKKSTGSMPQGKQTGDLLSSKPLAGLTLAEAEALVRKTDAAEISLAANTIEEWDSSLLVGLTRLARAASSRNMNVRTEDLPDGVDNLLKLALEAYKPENKRRETKDDPGFLELIGGRVMNAPRTAKKALAFIGSVSVSIGRLLRGQAAVSQQDVWRVFRECGVDALPIVALTSMLLGLILAFVSSIQLQSFGAEIYTASLVGLAMVRVMGPVLTGIVLAGRTGASFAAIIGSMQVNEEVDALSTFGIDPVDFLILPRVVGLVIMTPLLTVYADLMGIMGGFIVGITMLDIPASVYLANTWSSIHLNHILIGLFHAFVFGFVVALCGCYQGLNSGRSAEGVGGATTNAVVYSIVGIIVSTSIITVVLTVIDL